ncbi:MAG TPA: PAS domain-containing protein, partial [Chryseosolibacter sp.]
MSPLSNTKSPEAGERYAFFTKILNTLPVAVYVCDADGYVTSFNEAAVQLWGRRPEKGKDLWCGSWKIYNLDGTALPLDSCPMARTLKSDEPVVGQEIIIEQPDGTRFNVLPHPHRLYDDDGALVGAINMLVDVTSQSRFKDLEQRSEAMRKT